MTPADRIYMAGYRAALDAAERAGVAILQSTWGHPVRREHTAAGLCAFADAAREAMAAEGEVETSPLTAGILMTRTPLPTQGHTVTVSPSASVFASSPKPDRSDARLAGYSGDACDTCGSLSMKRVGSCLTCDACGSTTGCS